MNRPRTLDEAIEAVDALTAAAEARRDAPAVRRPAMKPSLEECHESWTGFLERRAASLRNMARELDDEASRLDRLLVAMQADKPVTGRRIACATEPDAALTMVKALLKSRGWSYRAAAGALGVCYQHISEVLNGRRNSPALLRRLSELPSAPSGENTAAS